MGNKILGKRSRSFYKGFNQRQVNYIKEKFSIISKKNILDKNLFQQQYKLNKAIVEKFYEFVDFDTNNQIQQYQFLCAVHTFCNMTVTQLGSTFFEMCTSKKQANKLFLTVDELKNFTQICLKYNYSLQNKQIDDKEITKVNKNKFLKYDFDKSKSISKEEFIKLCTKDQDYKKWFFNMGFITKNQLQFNDQIYDLVDSDIQAQIEKHLTQANPNASKIKRGIEHRLNDDEFQVVEQQGEQSLPPGKSQQKSKANNTKQKKPWQKFVSKCQISKDLLDRQNPNSPSQSLTMKYVFGYRSYDCRNNIKFDKSGKIVYHQGSVGIVLNDRANQQSYMNQHKDDVTCLDIVDDLVVTGQLGSQPSVILWKSNDKGSIKSELIITKKLKQSVGNVTLSKNKKLLAVNCNDTQHTVIIYDLSNLQAIKSSPTTQVNIKSFGGVSKSAIIDLKFSSDQKTVVAATIKQILFISFQNSTLNAVRGQFNDFSNSSSLCLLPLQTKYKDKNKKWMLSGMTNGSIYFWEEEKCVKAVSGHSGSVSALALIKLKGQYNSFVSGDKTGKIIVWNQNMQILSKCVIPKTNSPSNMIVSMSVSNSNELLVSTKSANVYKTKIAKQLIIKDANIIISGHSDGHLWALAVDQQPKSNVFYTGGEDEKLMKWGYGTQNKLLEQKKVPYKIRSLSHNSKQKVLAVGYMNGVIQIFNQNLISSNIKFDKFKNPDQQVLSLVKFNQQGNIILACYAFNKQFQVKILSYTGKEIKQIKKITLKSKVTAVDLQKAGNYVRLNTSDHQFLVYDISNNPTLIDSFGKYNKKQIVNAIWQTHTTILSPETQGFKTQGVSQSDITCCQRSRKYRNVILVGDKYSKIKLFNFVCKKYPLFNKYQGHSNEVTAIQFNKDQQYVISIGGEQKSIVVWKYDPDEVNNKQFFQDIKQQEVTQSQFAKAKGQQMPATPQYKGQIKQPSDFKQKYNAKKDNKLPQASVSIDHVFGIRNQYLKDQVRNVCRFSKNYDQILFPTACLGVKMHIQTKKQQFYLQHKEDIVSFAVDSSRTLMATGQMAEKNTKDPKKKIVSIYVWDVESKKMLKKLDGFHTIAVVLLQFSPSGKLLFSCGNDDKNSYAVYDWKAGSILYSGPISGGKVNGICWKSQTQFMTCGMDHVKFWQNGKGKQGKFSHGKLQTIYSCAYYKTQNIYITGSGSGNIHTWSGNSTTGVKSGHKGKVQSIVVKNERIYTGGDDGIIKLWKKGKNGQIQQIETFFDTRRVQKFKGLKNIEEQQFGILSIDFSQNSQTLITTKGASVISFKNSNPDNARVIHQGHYKGQLWALTSQIDQNYVITGGDDKTVRLWDLKKKEQVNRVYFKNKIRALDWETASSKKIVVADSRAQLYLYNKNLTVLEDQYRGKPYANNQKSQIQPWVEEIKFSPDCSALTYGTHGKSEILQIVSINKNKFSKQKAINFKGGSSAVNHIDWSKDSSSIAINTQAWEYLLFSNTGSKSSASSLKDTQWATYSRKYGFQSQGIFQDVDHSNINTICRSPDQSFLAVGYDDQTIRIFNYPCYIPHQVFKTYYGHSSHVTKIKFNQNKMFSIGGLDRTLIVWNVEGSQKKQIKEEQYQSQSDGLDDLDEDVDLPNKILIKKKKQPKIQEFYEVENQGDQFMAVKPWLGAIKQPTYTYPKPVQEAPNVKLNLQYVFGYRTKDCRQNLFYKDSNTIIFHAAAVLIYHDIKNNTQQLHNQHNDDILSIDYHQGTDTVLTGEIGPKPLVCLYKKGLHLHSFKAPVTKGVIAVSISPNGELGACVGIDQDHSIAILDLTKMVVLQKLKGSKKVITKIKWKNDQQFITIGINHYKEWKFDRKNKRTSKLNQSGQKSNYVSLDVFEDNLILAGASRGFLYNYSQNKKAKPITLYSESNVQEVKKKKNQDEEQGETKSKQVGVIQCIKITDKFVACGTRKGFILFLDKKDLSPIRVLNMCEQFDDKFQKTQTSQNYCIRSLDLINNKMLIGTFGSEIYQVQIDKQFNLNKKSFKNILKCHYSPNNTWTNEVWGLTIAENNADYMFTCSDDSTLRCWSISQRKLIYCKNINQQKNDQDLKNKQYSDELKLRAVAISPDNKYVVTGSKDGTVRIFRFDPEEELMLKQVKKFKHAQQWISDIKFGFKTLVIGSHDNGIYVYDFQDGAEGQEGGQQLIVKKKYKPMKKHSSYITHIDVSRDNCFLQSTCGAYELLFWDINSGKQLTGGATMLKDQKWKTWTCNLGWPVQGIYPKCTDGTFINAVDRSNSTISGSQSDFHLLAAGNDSGKVCVYNYPSLIKNSKFVQGKGHSSHVTTVRWNKTDEKLISVGGQDQCVMIWNVEKGESNPRNKSRKTK